jgi:hypothetical protein
MIDLEELEAKIGVMTPRMKLHKVLKRALLAIDRWKNRQRGDPSKGYKVMKERKNVS